MANPDLDQDASTVFFSRMWKYTRAGILVRVAADWHRSPCRRDASESVSQRCSLVRPCGLILHRGRRFGVSRYREEDVARGRGTHTLRKKKKLVEAY